MGLKTFDKPSLKDTMAIFKLCQNLVFLAKDIKAILKIRILTKSQNG